MLAVVAYAAVALTSTAPPTSAAVAPPVEPTENAYGQPIGPAVLTSPPTHWGKVVTVSEAGINGLAASATAARGGDANDRLGAISLNTRRLGYAYDRGLMVRVSNTGEIGGNDRGVHGAISFEAAGGYRLHIADTHGPFVRAGAEALVRGDALVYESMLEIPQVHAGYQYMTKETLLELTTRAGFSELGRSDTGYHATRHLDTTPEVGAMATVRTTHILLLAEWSHFLPRGHNTGGAIDWLDAGLCGTSKWVAVCTDFRLGTGNVNLASGPSVSSTVTQVGVTIGRTGS